MPVSPDVQNYHIGKGIVSFKEAGGATTFVDLGNAPSFVYTPTVEKKEHFSSREGIKTKDFTAITQVGATIKVQLDEITGLNLVSLHSAMLIRRRPERPRSTGFPRPSSSAISRSKAPTISASRLISLPRFHSCRPAISRSSPIRTISP